MQLYRVISVKYRRVQGILNLNHSTAYSPLLLSLTPELRSDHPTLCQIGPWACLMSRRTYLSICNWKRQAVGNSLFPWALHFIVALLLTAFAFGPCPAPASLLLFQSSNMVVRSLASSRWAPHPHQLLDLFLSMAVQCQRKIMLNQQYFPSQKYAQVLRVGTFIMSISADSSSSCYDVHKKVGKVYTQ